MSTNSPMPEAFRDAMATIRKMLDATEVMYRDNDFVNRIMVRAVLSNGGLVNVNPNMAEVAMSGKYALEYNSKGVTIHGAADSMWPNPTIIEELRVVMQVESATTNRSPV